MLLGRWECIGLAFPEGHPCLLHHLPFILMWLLCSVTCLEILGLRVQFWIHLSYAWQLIDRSSIFDPEMSGIFLGLLVEVLSVELVALVVVLGVSHMEAGIPSQCLVLCVVWDSFLDFDASDDLLLVAFGSCRLQGWRQNQLVRKKHLIWLVLSDEILVNFNALGVIGHIICRDCISRDSIIFAFFMIIVDIW